MTDAEIVLRKLAVLRDHVSRARRRRPNSVDDLLSDQDLQDALCMSLLVTIQEATDTSAPTRRLHFLTMLEDE